MPSIAHSLKHNGMFFEGFFGDVLGGVFDINYFIRVPSLTFLGK